VTVRHAATALLLTGLVGLPPLFAHDEQIPAIEPDPPPLFEPPVPGTYELPPIRRVETASLLDCRGEPSDLPGIGPDQVAVVAFVYRSCVDAAGCPLSLATLRRLDRKLAARPELSRRVRLVTVSFDPERDTPERMAELRSHMDPVTDWRFLTAPSEAEIGPVLSTFDQDALRRIDPEGQETGLIGHVLKVFLVDGNGWVRNVYSAGFLDTRILLSDIETVLAE
jgi:cytochrome oxidase Cu insertion factor (SCO1/SenC/PrrC family)